MSLNWVRWTATGHQYITAPGDGEKQCFIILHTGLQDYLYLKLTKDAYR